MGGPLEGVFVIDWSIGPAAAIVTMVLADYGAEVVRIDPPGGVPRHQLPSYQAWDRGKKSVVLSVDSAEGRETLERLLSRADVFVADNPDAVAKLWSVDPAERFEQLVYLCLSADGRMAEPRALDDTLTGARLGTFPGGLRHGGWLLPAYSTASVALIGVVGAWFAKVRGRGGQRVEVSMRDGLLDVLTFGQWRQDRISEAPPLDLRLQRLMFNMYECGDGKFLQFHTGAPGRFWRTMQLLGLDDRISPSLGLLEMGEFLSEEEFHVVETEVPLIMRTRVRDEWCQLFWDADICCQPVLEPWEAFADPQVLHNGMVVGLEDPEVGSIKSVGPPVKMWKSPAEVRGPRPLVGQHTEEILSSVEARPSVSAGGPADDSGRPPLDGVRVVDFGQYIAGPLASRILADLGADVVKVEPLAGDTMRPLAPTFEFGNRGKRSIALDLKSPLSQDIVHRLIGKTDVVGHNMRPGAAERLGIGYEALITVRPDLVYCASPGWGSTGPKAHHQSFQPVTGGTSGVYFDAGGIGNPPRRVAYEDYFNAALGAVGMIMALIHRERTGEGQFLESPQVNSGMFMMTHTTLDDSGRFQSRLQLDHSQMRYSALDGLYQTRDGLVAVTVSADPEFDTLVRALGRDFLSADPRFLSSSLRSRNDGALVEIFSEAFLERSADEWSEELGSLCEPVSDVPFHAAIWESDDARASGQVVEFHHPVHGHVWEVARLIGFSCTPCVFKAPGPLLGEHTEEILSEAGFDPDEIRQFEAAGVAGSAESRQGPSPG